MFEYNFLKKVSHRGTVTEVSGKNLLSIAVKKKGFLNAKDAKITSRVKQGVTCTSPGVRN